MTVAPILPERPEWTVDDLGDLPKDLPYELINGRLIVPSPTLLHQDMCVELLLALRVNCPKEFQVGIDLSMRVDHRNEPRPDVVAVVRGNADRSPLPVEDVVLAVEVVPTGWHFGDLYDKANVYARAGVQTYWVVDPTHERIALTEYTLGGAAREYEQVTHTEDLFVTERPWKVSVDLPALTARRNDLLAGADE
ncbi:Uma2 family endonuclease [Micromonospora sp. WMMD975]|uniref:Uma2 family endonuclease n=1 Tax=Micromonospora sp. WMMD975 TaxID=3016087 RepID=UPI00249C4CFC|nr:Uma2 family endonuclease [Micromonospora sp. WMMD975]WFE34225.1 Uma2 family endonuclease [Micromonospora sp. WMMD975]